MPYKHYPHCLWLIKIQTANYPGLTVVMSNITHNEGILNTNRNKPQCIKKDIVSMVTANSFQR